MSWAPHVTVAAVIQRDDRYLMVEERQHGQVVLNQPAGHLEPGESLLQAVCREVLEETRLPFHPAGLIGVYLWPVDDTERTYLRFCFCGEVGEPQPDAVLDPDIIASHWLTQEQIRSGAWSMRSPLVMRCIEDAHEVKPIDLRVLQHVLA